jgi:hypothetical protein
VSDRLKRRLVRMDAKAAAEGEGSAARLADGDFERPGGEGGGGEAAAD